MFRKKKWIRHQQNPVLDLRPGFFDSNHIHAPMVVKESGIYLMWYSGSDRKPNEHHVIGHARSSDGISWERNQDPVLVPSGRTGYYTTPAILRDRGGEVLREDGKFRMWFTGKPPSPDLYLATSPDGLEWELHSPGPIAHNIYCPSVIFDEGRYRMWYTLAEVGGPMVIRHATSEDGVTWALDEGSSFRSTEPWEHPNVLYPFVLTRDVYEMYYTSYGHRICEIAMATSEDGVLWKKGDGPILSPDPSSSWDSIYCSNPSVLVGPGGRDIMYYASRVDMEHKYYAIGLAIRDGDRGDQIISSISSTFL
jgi:predicted GH43/DUF377 family glycosyl hydrolase